MNLQSKRVLVTGADGFIGSHLVEHLLRAGTHVTALAQYNSFNFWGWLEDISIVEPGSGCKRRYPRQPFLFGGFISIPNTDLMIS